MKALMEKRHLTIRQAAKIIGVTELTLRNWDGAGKFKAVRHPINNYRMYTLEQIESLMKKLGHTASARWRTSKKLVIKVLED
ncbi:MAG: MerR family transcriptional regulator [bacterium]|nr:MerR family transcriptional regulator [bacterium]